VNAEALPYTLYIILIELAVGCLWVTLHTDLRGHGVTRGFVMTMSFCVAVLAGLAFMTGNSVNIGSDVDGYPIDGGWFQPTQRAVVALLAAAGLYSFSVFMGWDPIGRLAGLAGAVSGLVAVGTLAALLTPPAWGFVGVFIALFAGTLAMGAVSTSMVWGHWYLTEGSLPHRPMRELAWICIGVVIVQSIILVINVAVPERITPVPSNPVDVNILLNPAFFFRVTVGLVFTGVLSVLALKTARMGAMQSTTGLFYVAMGSVFTGEVLARGVQLLTAKPV
jgi:hypothetical protein